MRYILALTAIIISGIILNGCTPGSNQKNMKKEKAIKKVLMVVAPIDFRDAEYFEPKKVLENNGIEVKTASIQGKTARSADGKEIALDLNIADAKTEDYGAIMFIGGPGMNAIVNDESLQLTAKKFYDAGRLTTAICVAPSILAKAGLLEGKKATSWDGVKTDLEQGKAVYTGDPVTVDGKIITANGPEAAKQFGEAVKDALSN